MLATRRPTEFTGTRLLLVCYLASALKFQWGANILGTAISPSWDQIGKLSAIAVIRTELNSFLSMETQRENNRRIANPQRLTQNAKRPLNNKGCRRLKHIKQD